MLALRPQWQQCRGYGFGFRQSVLIGRLVSSPGAEVRVRAYESALARLLGDEELGPRAAQTAVSEDPFGWLLRSGVALQRSCGVPVFEVPSVGPAVPTADGTLEYRVVTPYARPAAAVAALGWLVSTAAGLEGADSPASLARATTASSEALAALRKGLARQGHAGVNTDRILRRVVEARLPFGWLDGDTYIVGQGWRSRWLKSTFTDATSVIGTKMARGKAEAARVLAAHGLPVPAHRLARDEDDAARIASDLGYPVVVKPADQDGGKGVHAGLASEDVLRRCYRDAAAHSPAVLVEKFHPGRDYRLTVCNGRLIKAIERVHGSVVGDGQRTIRELIELGAADGEMRRRSAERGKALLDLDQEAMELIAEAGLTPASVPPPGRVVRLRRRANVSSGGTTRVVTSDVHPDNRRLAERAADALRLDVAGVDLLIAHIATSWHETGAVVCEVNAQPQLGDGGAEGLYGDFLRELVGGDGRIPVVIVLDDAALASHHLEWTAALRGASEHRGTATVSGGQLYVDGACEGPLVTDATTQAMIALRRRDVRRLLVIAEPQDIARHGLPAADVDALVVVQGQWCTRFGGAVAATVADMIGPHVRGPMLCLGPSELGRRLRAMGLSGQDVAAHPADVSSIIQPFLEGCPFLMGD